MLDQLINKINTLDGKDAETLNVLVEQYPYCQSIQLMYAIALANVHSTKLNAQVQRAAVAMPDRMKLCQMVSNGEYEWIKLMNEIENKKKEEFADMLNDDFMLVERYLDNIGEISSDTLPYNIESASIADNVSDDDLPLFDLDQTSAEPDETDALINNFILAEENGELFVPKAQKILDFENEEDNAISLKKIREKAFLSESLAKIYVKQHKYEQAIAIFSALNLRYSKKITYFADQIRYLETILMYQNGEENTSKK